MGGNHNVNLLNKLIFKNLTKSDVGGDAGGNTNIDADRFYVACIEKTIPADNGVTSTQGALDYVRNLVGAETTLKDVCFAYKTQLDEIENTVRSIGPRGIVVRYKSGQWQSTAIGSAYTAVLPEGNVQIICIERK